MRSSKHTRSNRPTKQSPKDRSIIRHSKQHSLSAIHHISNVTPSSGYRPDHENVARRTISTSGRGQYTAHTSQQLSKRAYNHNVLGEEPDALVRVTARQQIREPTRDLILERSTHGNSYVGHGSMPSSSVPSHRQSSLQSARRAFSIKTTSMKPDDSSNDSHVPSHSCQSAASAQQQQQQVEQHMKALEKVRQTQRSFSLRLYRAILRSHRILPPEMRMVGDAYVKEEFNLHRDAKPDHLKPFFEQWLQYLEHLRDLQDNPHDIGKNIPHEELDSLDQERLDKLYKMHDETARIFGGHLYASDVGLDELPEHMKESGLFSQSDNSQENDPKHSV